MSSGPGVPTRTEGPLARPRALGRRVRDRGAAAVEFALVLIFVTPLVLGLLDYGKYMYVSVVANEAVRMGARELSLMSITNCGNTTPRNNAITAAQATTGATRTYLTQIGLGAVGTAGGVQTTVTATCQTTVGATAADPTWKLVVQVDYQPTIGYLTTHNLMPKGGGTTARVNASLAMRGK